MRVRLREKRQITLPNEVCEALQLEIGDVLEITLNEGVAVLRPSRAAALDALNELRRALKDAGVTEEELLANGRKVREELVRERWPHLFPER